jgi:hypothetical protein
MAGITDYAETRLLNTLRNVSFAVAGTWIKLHTDDPGENATGNAALNTVRQPITFSAASGNTMSSSGTITWSVTNTEVYSHWSIWDSNGTPTGNAIWKGSFSSSATVTAGDTFQISTLTLTLE